MGSFESLISSSLHTIPEERLEQVLRPYVQIVSQSGRMVPRSRFQSLSETQQVVVSLLSHSVRYQLGYEDDVWVRPSTLGQTALVDTVQAFDECQDLYSRDLIANKYECFRVLPEQFENVAELLE